MGRFWLVNHVCMSKLISQHLCIRGCDQDTRLLHWRRHLFGILSLGLFVFLVLLLLLRIRITAPLFLGGLTRLFCLIALLIGRIGLLIIVIGIAIGILLSTIKLVTLVGLLVTARATTPDDRPKSQQDDHRKQYGQKPKMLITPTQKEKKEDERKRKKEATAPTSWPVMVSIPHGIVCSLLLTLATPALPLSPTLLYYYDLRRTMLYILYHQTKL